MVAVGKRIEDMYREIGSLRDELQLQIRRRTELESALRAASAAASRGHPVEARSPRTSAPMPVSAAPRLRIERVRDVLLWTGAALVIVSAFSLAAVLLARGGGDGKSIFTATRVAIVLVVLAVALALTSIRLRRRLPVTAEVLVVVSFGLLFASAHLLRQGGAAAGISARTWWGSTFAVAAVLALVGGRAGFRVLRLIAPGLIAVVAAIALSSITVPWTAAMVTSAVAIGFLGLAARLVRIEGWREAAIVALAVGAAYEIAGVVLACVGVAHAMTTVAAIGPAVATLALTVPPALVTVRYPADLAHRRACQESMVAACTVLFVAAGTFPAVPHRGWPVALATAVSGIAVLVVDRAIRRRLGMEMTIVGGAAVAVAVVCAVRAVAIAAVSPLGWLSQPWALDPRSRADLWLQPSGTIRVPSPGWALAAVVLGWLAVVIVTVGRPLDGAGATTRQRPFALASAVVVVVLASLAPLVAQRTVATVFATTFGVLVVLLVVAGMVLRSNRVPLVALIAAVAAAVPATGWSATNQWMTVGGLWLVAAVCAATAVMAAAADWRKAATTAATLLAGAALLTTCLAVGLEAAVAALVLAAGGAVIVAVAAIAAGPAGDQLTGVGIVFLVTAGLLVSNEPWYIAGVVAIATVAAAAAGALAANPRPYHWATASLALATLLVSLAAAHVQVVEAYTLPAALGALGAGHAIRRRGHDVGSWAAYGAGLAILLWPTLIAGLALESTPRVVAAGAGGLITLLVGAFGALRAPLLIGAVTVLAAAADLARPIVSEIPRWIVIGAPGALLLWLGATFERRRTGLRRMRARFRALG